MFWIPSQLEGAYVGQDATLECHSEAYPKSINYWVKENGSMLISSEKDARLYIDRSRATSLFNSADDKYESIIVDSGYKVYMKLRIRNVTKADFMEYRCLAKSSLGESDGTITLYGTAKATHIKNIYRHNEIFVQRWPRRRRQRQRRRSGLQPRPGLETTIAAGGGERRVRELLVA